MLAALRTGTSGKFSLYTVSLATGADTLYRNTSGNAALSLISGPQGQRTWSISRSGSSNRFGPLSRMRERVGVRVAANESVNSSALRRAAKRKVSSYATRLFRLWASHFSCFAKKSDQKKATPTIGPAFTKAPPSLRCSEKSGTEKTRYRSNSFLF